MHRTITGIAVAAFLLVTAGTTAAAAPPRMATAATPTVIEAPTRVSATPRTDVIVGVNYHPLKANATAANRQSLLDAMQDAGTEWVRIDASWAALQPTDRDSWDTRNAVKRLDQRIREVTLRGMKVDLMLYRAPQWASGSTDPNARPTDPDDFANAAAWVAERYSGSAPLLKIDALELWNEPNKNATWAQSPADTQVTSFAALIKAAGPAVKAANPDVTTVVGGIAAADTSWLQKLYAVDGVVGSYDVLGVHPYQSPGDAAPEATDEEYAQYYMTGLKAVADLMDSAGDPARIWATELGWTSHDNSGYPGGVPNYARGVTEQQQADYLLRGLAELGDISPRITGAFWFTGWNTSTGDPQRDNYGLLNTDFSRKPAWDAMLCAQTGQCSYVRSGQDWTFQDSGADLGTDWRNLGYDDSAWTQGPTEAGYGDHDEATGLDAGTLRDRALTVYARHTFAVGTNPDLSAGLTLRMKIDDGAVAFLNGTEVARFNLPTGEVNSQTRARRDLSGAEESKWRTFDLATSDLVPGENILAIEVHQSGRASNDLSLDATLDGIAPDPVVAGSPGAPTGVTATIAEDSAIVSWTAPADASSSPITSYVARSTPGGLTCTTATTSCTVSGLSPGVPYIFRVHATNDAGTGPASDPSAPVASVGVAAAPTNVILHAGNAAALIAWTRPFDGGSPISSYTVTALPGGLTCTSTSTSTLAGCRITGLTNGTTYTFSVHATNAVGDGPATLSDPATPYAPADPPTAVTAQAGDGQAGVSWTPPSQTGGSPITGYLVTSSPDSKRCATRTTACTVTGLTNGTAYTFTVRTLNRLTLSDPSEPSEGVTPTGTAPTLPPGDDPTIDVGVNYQPMWSQATDSVRATQLGLLQQAGTKWVRIDVSWATLQPNGPDSYDMGWGVPEVDERVREAREHGMNILLMLYWAPEWSSGSSSKTGRPSDPQDFANVAAWVAKRYDGASVDPELKIDAIELWNEPNLSAFWDQSPAETAVSAMADLVKAAGPAAKAANPDITVVSPATSYTDIPWYTEFYSYGVLGTFDVLGVHPYQSPGDAAPDAFDPNWATYYLANLTNLVALMDTVGDPALIWATEYGWTSHGNESGTPNYALGVSQATQAEYLIQALKVMDDISPRIRNAFWYNTWNGDSGDAMQDNFGLLNVDLSPKPVYDAFTCAATTGYRDC